MGHIQHTNVPFDFSFFGFGGFLVSGFLVLPGHVHGTARIVQMQALNRRWDIRWDCRKEGC